MIIPWHGTESMQKNFSESVANVHREKSNKCSLRDYASSYANASSRADVLWTHLKKHIGEKPRGGGNFGNAERNRFLRRSSVGQFTKSRYSLENVNIL